MSDRQFWTSILILMGAAIMLAGLGRYTNVDLYLADAVFDFSMNEFPLRSQWFYDDFMHGTMKALLICLGTVPIVTMIADFATGRGLLNDRVRKCLMVVIAASVLVPLTISIMKSTSIHHCPWSLERYGGFAPYQRIFDRLQAGVSPGHCFPAGHASSGLWLSSVAVFWLPQKPWRALCVFAAGLMPGLALGLAQQMRGAHFLTHTLWSVWIAALVILVLVKLFLRTLPPS